jgi:hypothetical protein
MNTILTADHPSEEQLMEFALEGGAPEIGRHVAMCAACAKTVGEFRAVKQRVASIDEEDVPERVERRVLSIARHGRSVGTPSGGLRALFANPFLIALIVALVVILLYFLVGSEVFKTP